MAITHLHLDHTGWLLHDSRPFRGAEVLLTGPEWAADGNSELAPQVRTVADGEEIFPGVHAGLVPGHTPGHAAYVLSSGGRRLIAFGDALYSPVQVAHPELSATKRPARLGWAGQPSLSSSSVSSAGMVIMQSWPVSSSHTCAGLPLGCIAGTARRLMPSGTPATQ